jgi:CRP-like cAMP-binding protein
MSASNPPQELPAIGFLADMDASHRGFLASFGRFVRPHNGDVLIDEGKEQQSLYLILSGLLHVVAHSGERNILVAALGAGDSLGEVNIFDPAQASASVFARSECLVWEITADELLAAARWTRLQDPSEGFRFVLTDLLSHLGHAQLANQL